MRILATTLVLFLLAGQAGAGSYDQDCDRTYDGKVTAGDALAALQLSVDSCKRTFQCDSDGDYDPSAADALALLRYAVGMPQELECSCIYMDECFEDEDCQGPGYPEGMFCAAYLCAECEFDTECPEGKVCDACSLSCIDAPGN